MSVPARDWLRLAGGVEEDQLSRLATFRAAHPEVVIGDGGFGTWLAVIPEENGETVVSRYTLRELLDKLGSLYEPRG